ncbi:MAG: hypothetical protein HY943_17725 [Gammaproteobacteria bacterium]|nr:hypothetical protein [Gammaproteobacteria bacterium]
MSSFESLIRASAANVIAEFSALKGIKKGDVDTRREQIAGMVGLNAVQLVCGVGFNAAVNHVLNLARFLGFASTEALVAERNYAFIHDRYRELTINNILEIYAVLGHPESHRPEWADLIISRLNNVEAQLEETINPVLIGSYKLEVRAIYENRLAAPALLDVRLDRQYAVLRDITGESMLLLETGAMTPQAFLERPGLTAEEKSRAVFQRLIPKAVAESYLAAHPAENSDGKLRAAVTELS